VGGIRGLGLARVVVATTAGVEAEYYPVDLSAAAPASMMIGLVAGHCCSCSVGDRSLSTSDLHWVYVNLATGEYRVRYLSGSTVREARGYARVLLNASTLDLSKLSWSERYALGPVVIMVNPYMATRDYTVTIIDINGGVHQFILHRLVDDPSQVVLDAAAFWEDLWWPGTTASLDNYIDHVIRVTVFANKTARVEVLHASGCYLHMLMYRPGGLPGFDSVPGIIERYLANDYRLPQSDGVVYVKTHGASVPPAGDSRVWDPVRGVWVEEWPIIFSISP
jgi:hypothetical protein